MVKQKREKNETEKSEAKSKQTKTKEEQHETTTIIISVYDKYSQLGEKPNNKSVTRFFFPPLNLSLNSSSLQSYSVYLNLCWSREAVYCSELVATVIVKYPVLSEKQKSVS